MATDPLVVRRHVRFSSGERGRKRLRAASTSATPQPAAAVPRIGRLMALAIVLEEMLLSGQVSSYHELASLCHVSPSRVCQVMALACLAPDLQEAILFLAPRRPTVTERRLRDLLGSADWDEQRAAWNRLRS
jgi:hypothetical protein